MRGEAGGGRPEGQESSAPGGERRRAAGVGGRAGTVKESFSPWMVVILSHSLLWVNQANFWFHSFSKPASPLDARSCTAEGHAHR